MRHCVLHTRCLMLVGVVVTILLAAPALAQFPKALVKKVAKVAEKTGTEVAVSADEKALLASIFGTTLDVGKLKFLAGSPVAIGASRTVESTIFFDKKHNVRDAAYRRSGAFVSLLAHEATHARQFQNVGHACVVDSLFSQGVGVVAHDDRNKAYEYTLDPKKRFQTYNSERQAQVVGEYVGLVGFEITPKRCRNFAKLGKKRFLGGVEQIIRRDFNVGFKGLDRGAVGRIVGRYAAHEVALLSRTLLLRRGLPVRIPRRVVQALHSAREDTAHPLQFVEHPLVDSRPLVRIARVGICTHANRAVFVLWLLLPS